MPHLLVQASVRRVLVLLCLQRAATAAHADNRAQQRCWAPLDAEACLAAHARCTVHTAGAGQGIKRSHTVSFMASMCSLVNFHPRFTPASLAGAPVQGAASTLSSAPNRRQRKPVKKQMHTFLGSFAGSCSHGVPREEEVNDASCRASNEPSNDKEISSYEDKLTSTST
jgi:hypothetical protein